MSLSEQTRADPDLSVMEGHCWAPDFRPPLVEALARLPQADGWGDMTDPKVIAAFRDPGPDPPPAKGVSWSERTIPNAAGDHQIRVRIYRPDRPSALRPAYMMYHSGGLCFGSLNSEHERCVALTRACGAVGISVDFRLAPDHPAATILDDCYSALRWATDDAAGANELDIDPRRIALTGASGGGMATLAVAQMARDRGDTHPMLQLALYPNADDRVLPQYTSRHERYPFVGADNLEKIYENLRAHEPYPPYIIPARTEADLDGLCPALVIVAGNDPLRDEAVDYTVRMLRAGVPTALHVIPGVSHGFDRIAPDCAATKLAYSLSHDALRTAAEQIQ